jgi:hypothetical protein
MILHDFEDAWTLTSPGLSARVFTAKLRYAERGAYLVLHWLWKASKSSLLEPIQNNGLSPGTRFSLAIQLSQF